MRTVLIENRHSGPLLVQKAIYPEGEQVCHAVIVHPPGGIAGGDELTVEIDLESEQQRSGDDSGGSKMVQSAAPAMLGSKPPSAWKRDRLSTGFLKKISFINATRAESTFTLQIEPGATAIGWEIGLLGRQASGEAVVERAALRFKTSIERTDGLPLWIEQFRLDASSTLRQACQGLFGFNVFGTLWAIGSGCTAASGGRTGFRLTLRERAACRSYLPAGGHDCLSGAWRRMSNACVR